MSSCGELSPELANKRAAVLKEVGLGSDKGLATEKWCEVRKVLPGHGRHAVVFHLLAFQQEKGELWASVQAENAVPMVSRTTAP